MDFVETRPVFFAPITNYESPGFLFLGDQGQFYAGRYFFCFSTSTTLKMRLPSNVDFLLKNNSQPTITDWQINFMKPEGKPHIFQNHKGWFTFKIKTARPLNAINYYSEDPYELTWLITHSGEVTYSMRLPQTQSS